MILILGMISGACKRQEELIVQPGFGVAVINTYTTDSLLFSVSLDNATLIGDLASPVASVSIPFKFYDPVAHLQVYERYNWNRIIIDTNIKVDIKNNYISIVQLRPGQKPYFPSRPLNEPPPVAGYCKVNIVYSSPADEPRLDSVKCEIVVDTSAAGNGSKPYVVDNIILSRNEFSERYYEVKKSLASFLIRCYDPVTNAFLGRTYFEQAVTTQYLDFNTVNLRASVDASSNLDFRVARIY